MLQNKAEVSKLLLTVVQCVCVCVGFGLLKEREGK